MRAINPELWHKILRLASIKQDAKDSSLQIVLTDEYSYFQKGASTILLPL